MDYASQNTNELTDDQKDALYEVIDRVPAVALPHSGFGKRPTTDAEVLEIIRSMGQHLSRTMQENEALREQDRQRLADLEAFRRVIGTAQ